MKNFYFILSLVAGIVCMTSCVQISTGLVRWELCIRSNDTLEIEIPTYDNIVGSFGEKMLTTIERHKVDSGRIKVFGDVHIGGDYLYTNKDHKYRYAERSFTIRRLSNNDEVKAFVLLPHNGLYMYGWIPTDVSQRDSVFEVLIRHYGEDNIKTMSINQDAMHLVYQP